MRTTVTLEPDVQKLLKDAAHRSGRPFKQRVFSLGRAKVDLTKAGALAADLEDQDKLAKARPGPRK
jgi:hypothetical protein